MNQYSVEGETTFIFIKPSNKPEVTVKISTDDLKRLVELGLTWYVGIKKNGYCRVMTRINGKTTLLHRFLTDAPEGMTVDHINHDTLDNRRENLRIVTNAENQQNKKGAYKNSKSRVRGVSWNKTANKWMAMLAVNGKRIYVGCYIDLSEAERAVKEARSIFMPFSSEAQLSV